MATQPEPSLPAIPCARTAGHEEVSQCLKPLGEERAKLIERIWCRASAVSVGRQVLPSPAVGSGCRSASCAPSARPGGARSQNPRPGHAGVRGSGRSKADQACRNRLAPPGVACHPPWIRRSEQVLQDRWPAATRRPGSSAGLADRSSTGACRIRAAKRRGRTRGAAVCAEN